MPRPIRWLLLSIGTLFFLAVAGIVAMKWWSHLHEGTYYGPHTDILHVGERGGHSTVHASRGAE